MNNSLKMLRSHAALLLVIGIGLSGCAGVAPSSTLSLELQQRIEAARTRGDHEALASHYTREAAAARAVAADHRKMARSYAAMPSGKGSGSMPAHCNSIVAKYEGIASDYDSMAAAHQGMAK